MNMAIDKIIPDMRSQHQGKTEITLMLAAS